MNIEYATLIKSYLDVAFYALHPTYLFIYNDVDKE